MTVFAAISPSDNPKLAQAVAEKYGDGNHYALAPGQFLIFAPNITSNQLKGVLGIDKGDLGRVLILRVTNYSGWHSRDMWEWLSTHLAEPPATEAPGG